MRVGLLDAIVQSAASRRARYILVAIDSCGRSARTFGSTGYNELQASEQNGSGSVGGVAAGQERAQKSASSQCPPRVVEGSTSSRPGQNSSVFCTPQRTSNTPPAIRNVPSMENTSPPRFDDAINNSFLRAQQSSLNRSFRPISDMPTEGDPFGMDGASDETGPWVMVSPSRVDFGNIHHHQSRRSLRQAFDYSAVDQVSPARQVNFARAQVDNGSPLARARQNNLRENNVGIENPAMKNKRSSSVMHRQASSHSLGQKKPNPQEIYPPEACLFVAK